MGDALKNRPQDVGPVPELHDSDIDSLIETYLGMENQNNWFKFGPYSTIEKGHSISGPGLLECKTLAEVFLEQQPTARLPLAQFKKGVIRALDKKPLKEWAAKEKLTKLFPNSVIDRFGVVLDHLRKLARALVKDKDDTWARTTRKNG